MKIGFIGCGNMGQAMLSGMLSSGQVKPSEVFVSDKKLMRDTDRVFRDYLDKYYANGEFEKIPWYDLFFWEFRMSSWNGLVITGEHLISFDITIPYNNRELLRTMLLSPVEARRKDELHRAIMRKMNPEIADCGVSVTNLKHTNTRAWAERLYLEVFSRLNIMEKR